MSIIYKEFIADVKMDDEEGVMTSYASTFGNVDYADDIIMPGAFDKTISERKAKDIKFLYQHDYTRPLGVHTKFEITPEGLKMTSKFALQTQLGRESYELAKMGAFGGVSIGFQIPRGKSTFTDAGIREIHEVKLHEVSLVTFPCNPEAKIGSVKSARDFETLIKEEFGVERAEARKMYQSMKSLAVKDDSETQADTKEMESRDELVNTLQELVKTFKQ